MHRSSFRSLGLAFLWLAGIAVPLPQLAAADAGSGPALFARTNLLAWCIVPFDAKKRGPEERAAMLEKLGFRSFAYDYRAEHIPTFSAEIEALARHHIALTAWWFPTVLNDEARLILGLLQKHQLHPQLWVMGGGEPTHSPAEQTARVAAEAERIRPIALAAAGIGSTVGLYNHGGWFGEPENQIAIIEHLRPLGITNVGIVYNLHHGHGHLDRFPALLQQMKPYLLALNLNGMVRNGDHIGREIVPLGKGDLDLHLLRIIAASGWTGPIGLLNHTDEDAETRLQENLLGLERLTTEMARPDGASAGAGGKYWAVEDPAAREQLPLYQTIPAATPDELTPANGFPPPATYLTWERSHGDNGGTRYSGLDQINRKTVAGLTVAWTYHAGDGMGNIQCNPIMVHGVLIAPIPSKHMVGIDAATGQELWRFKPDGRPAYRGLIYWPGFAGAGERVIFPSGSWLYALDPRTGQPVPGFGNGGRIPLGGRAQREFGSATAAPTIFERTVIVPGWEKDVWAFDVVTGAARWTFHTVPEAGEFGAETWDRPEIYAANCWGGMALDASRGIAYITTGGPKENFIGVGHRGQNLFANYVVAIDARTGQRLWHFQEIRHDIWDLDIPAPPNLTTITRDGKRIDVVTAVSKMGNTILLDRVSGKPIFPFRLRRAPVSDLPGELTWPYQPDLELPEPFAKPDFTAADLSDRTPEVAEYVFSRFKSATAAWFRPFSEGKMNVFCGLHGGAEWTGACSDPTTGRFYVTANHIPDIVAVFRDEDPPDDPQAQKTDGALIYDLACSSCHGANRVGLGTAPPLRGVRNRLSFEAINTLIHTGKNLMPAHTNLTEVQIKAVIDFILIRDRPLPATPRGERPHYSFNGYPKFLDQEGYPGIKPPWGTLNCLDLNTGKSVWQVPLGEHEELTAQGVKITGTENFGGAIVTAGGLVFCAGTRDSRIRAFDSDNGRELWSAKLPWVGSAPPATYSVNGRQYIVIAATGGGKLETPAGDAYVAFALPVAGR